MFDPITLPFNTLLNNRYRVLNYIGGGGFSQVFEVEDKADQKANGKVDGNNGRTTIKVLKLLNLSAFRQPQTQQKAIALFQREAEFLSQFRHPGVPRVEPDGYFVWLLDQQTPLHGLVMEKIAGINLQAWLQQQEHPLPQSLAINWLRQLVDILTQLHQWQFFHRDIKPSNIMLRPDGQLVLIDFGAVREMTVSYLAKQQLQETGTAIISAGYTPPEQAEGRAVPQSDFFALGRTFVYLFTKFDILDLPKDPQTGALRWRERASHLAPALVDFIDHLMAPFPGQRPQTCEAITQALDRIERHLIWQSWLPLVQYFRYWQVGKRRWVRFTPALAGLLLLGSINLWSARSQISVGLNDQGYFVHTAGNMALAHSYYQLALLFDAQNPFANFNLGDLFETQRQFERAKAAYYLVLDSDPAMWKAYNNLARLEILDQQYDKAISLLAKVNLNLIGDPLDRYAVLKNLGWAQLELKQYDAAQKNLEAAIQLDFSQAGAHCLMVPVHQAAAKQSEALAQLDLCLKLANPPRNPDDQKLSDLARRALPSSDKL